MNLEHLNFRDIDMKKNLNQIVSEIAECLDCGMVCFLNPDTKELLNIPSGVFEGTFEADQEVFEDDLKRIDTEWERFIRMEPLESFESFRIMKNFIEEVVIDRHLKYKLQNALERRKPFHNFKTIIDYSDYRQAWFDFKKKSLKEHVANLLDIEFNMEK